jgi:DNA-binding LacI/PurR family transcriptional regulator
MGFAKNHVNLSSIATKLGISISTVSRAMRGSTGIHPTTRRQVLATAESLGYLTADSAPVKADTTLQVLTLSIARGASIDTGYLSGISRAAVSFNVSLLSHHYQPEDVEKIFDESHQPLALKAGKLDGIILMHRWPEKVIRKLHQLYPLISIVHSYSDSVVDVVRLNETEGMTSLVRHLASLGHKKIGFLGHCPEVSWARARHAGYIEALSSQGMAYHADHVLPVSLQEALEEDLIVEFTAAEAVRKLIAQGVTAWISANESIGYSLARGLISRGVRLPEDASITGFHTFMRPPYGLPILTSVKCPPEELGENAMRFLTSKIAKPDILPCTVLLPCTLVVGATTGPAPVR